MINLDMGLIKFHIHNCRHANKQPTVQSAAVAISNGRFFSSKVSQKYKSALDAYNTEALNNARAEDNIVGEGYIRKCLAQLHTFSV